MVFVVYLSPIMRQLLITLTIFILSGFVHVNAQTEQIDPKRPKYNEFGQRIRYDQFGNELDQFGNPVDPTTRPSDLKDSTEAEVKTLAPKLFMWKITDRLGNIEEVKADTLFNYFQNSNLDDGIHGTYNNLGNLGAPRISRIFLDREKHDYGKPFFMQPYSTFYFKPSQFYFTNSNVPYTNLTYHSSGNKVNGDDHFKAYFSVNTNERFAFGFNFDYNYGHGYYQSQATSFFNGGVFASYRGDKYEAHFMYNNFVMKMAENGGITDDKYITNPEDMSEGKKTYETQNIPVFLTSTWNRNNDFFINLSHRYKLGFKKKVQKIVPNEEDKSRNDTINYSKYIPVTSFIHTLKVERNVHKFIGKNEPQDYYKNTYINIGDNSSNDITTSLHIHNTFGLALTEGFNKYVPMGLTVFISNTLSKFELMTKDPNKTKTYNQNELFIGGELTRKTGNIFNYRIMAETGISKYYTGTFNIDGEASFKIPMKRDTISLKALFEMSNRRPEFFMRHFHSNHFYWDAGKNDVPKFDNIFKQRIGGEIAYNRTNTRLKFEIENIKDYLYFGPDVTPIQHSDNIQVMAATLKQNFKLGIFHLDNEITWQKSSNIDVIPVPSIMLYHNLYIQTAVAKKVLKVQLGADVRYFTKYDALGYNPVIQNFHLQPDNDRKTTVGAYPIINVYANLHLKRTRIYAMVSHVNEGMGNNRSFLVPHYPINPRLFKLGISWNLYD